MRASANSPQARRSAAPGCRSLLREASGSLGDLGTFLPITVGLVQVAGMDAGTILVLTGLMCIATGLVFRVPMALQPMKAAGALAIAGILTAGQVQIAGLTVAVCVLLVGLTGLAGWVDRFIPKPVLRGLQVAVAIQLARSGVLLALFSRAEGQLRPLLGAEGLLLVAGAFLLLLLLRRHLETAALILMAAGLIGSLFKNPGLLTMTGMTVWRPHLAQFDFHALSGVWKGGLIQLPLTLLNSVFAVSILAAQLFPDQARRTTPARLAISVGLMNLLVCPLGGMPLCHGSGGLAAQHRFGGRTGLTMVMRGLGLLVPGLLWGAAAVAWMQAFPATILGVFLLIAGCGLIAASRCWQTSPCLATAAATVCANLATGSLVAGFAAGWVFFAFTRWIELARWMPWPSFGEATER